MKAIVIKCAFTPRLVECVTTHLQSNPNGLPLFSGKSYRKCYFGEYRVYETKTQVVVDAI